jgi:hypothetical protein
MIGARGTRLHLRAGANKHVTRRASLGAAVLLLVPLASGPALPQGGPAPSWPEVKCARYRAATSAILARRGTAGLGRAFLDSHAAFIASGCTEGRSVCPRSPEEFALADTLTVAAMNFGTASTFLPFACR